MASRAEIGFQLGVGEGGDGLGSGKKGGNAEASRGERVGDHLGSGIFQSRPEYLEQFCSVVYLPRCWFPCQIYIVQSSPRGTLTGLRDAVDIPYSI